MKRDQIFAVILVGLVVAMLGGVLLLSSCQNPNQARDQYFFSLCPPGKACLSKYFAVNRLKRNLYVKFDQKRERWVQTTQFDPMAVELVPGGIADFWREPMYVVATPGAGYANLVRPDERPTSTSGK